MIESKYLKVAAVSCGVLLLILLSFALGVKVGFDKALYSAQWGKSYERNFLGGDEGRGGRPSGMWGGMMGKGMRNAHGLGGEILSLSGKTIVMKDRNNEENTVQVVDDTIIRRGKENISVDNLTVGEKIVVMGRPGNDGVIAARLIRVFDVDRSSL